MRKQNCWLMSLLIVGLAVFPLSLVAKDGANQNGFRSHGSKTLQDGTEVKETSIFLSKGHNVSPGRVNLHKIALLDCGKVYGRWIVEAQSASNDDYTQIKATYRFACLNTGEEVLVVYQLEPGADSGGHFTCTAGNHKEVFTGEEVEGLPGSLHAWITKCVSTQFSLGLDLLHRLASAPQFIGLDFSAFTLLYGKDVRAVVDKTLADFVAEPVDCDFDASFGYPCAKNEKNSLEGKLNSFPLP